MAITFYYGAGSPYAWRVWLALEHKRLGYDRRVLSFSEGDLKKPGFIALNPRHKVPVLADDTEEGPITLYESAAILEYLDEAYPESGSRLFPGATRGRALVRRLVCEADNYVAPAVYRLVRRVLFTPQPAWNPWRIEQARAELVRELGCWVPQLSGEWLSGTLSAADFTLYPLLALALRCEKRKQDVSLRESLPEPAGRWMRRVEDLPYFRQTWPEHWN